MHIDPLRGFDWAAHWRRLVEERDEQVAIDPGKDVWAAPIRSLAYDPEQAAKDPLIRTIEPFFGPNKTAIDAGAGAGRHAVPLAERLDWVTAVEPSEGMRERIPHRDNLTVVASTWEDAEVAPADLTVCAHVLYFVADPVPFIEKLEAVTRERVFVFMRDRPMPSPNEALFEVLTGAPRARSPQLYDLWNLLRTLGINADVTRIDYEIEQFYADLDEAASEAARFLGVAWQEEAGRAWLAQNLTRREDGMLTYGGPMVAGIAHWQPRPR